MTNSDSATLKIFLALAGIFVALLGAGYFAFVKTGPQLTLSPDGACDGSTISLMGSNWKDDQQVSIYLAGGPVGNATTNDNQFEANITVGSLSEGNYTIEVVGQQTSTSVNTILQVGIQLPGIGCNR